MKSLFKKSWFISIVIFAMIISVFLINLWIMSLKFIDSLALFNFWTLGNNISYGEDLFIFSSGLKVAFYISILPMLFAGISLLRKNNSGITVTVLYFLGFESALIFFQIFTHLLSTFGFVLIVLNIVFIMSIVFLTILRKKILVQLDESKENDYPTEVNSTKISTLVLLVDIFSIIVFLSTFLIPLYVLVDGETYSAMIINVIFSSDTNIHAIIGFAVDFVLFLGALYYFVYSLSTYFYDKSRFVNQSKTFIGYVFFATIAFFVSGLTLSIYYTINHMEVSTTAYIPLLMMFIVMLVYAILKGKYYSYYKIANTTIRIKYPRIEPLLFVFIMTAITLGMLFLPIVNFHITAGTYNYDVNLTGINILQDYASLDSGYRLIAFMLVVMLISVGLGLAIVISSYLSKYRHFNSVVKSVTSMNVFFVFIVAISGYYFQVAQEINQVAVADIVAFYNVSIPSWLDYSYSIKTYTIYALVASVAILILMYLRKSFDREELYPTDDDFAHSISPSSTNLESSSVVEEDALPRSFDPCPAFTEIDVEINSFKKDLENRKTFKTKEPSLNKLVNFVVEYARDSKLHLSYTPRDIATFVSGLGASRLSILQGMSGTGKTSLPKIFSEAIFGNCNIIEVESSWKDKNELLGYYNEFSTKYTPKKFTLALYKAALNKEITTFILLDEMNLSRIEYYFSDFLSLMENEESHREIKLVNIKLARTEEEREIEYAALSNGHTLKVPTNVWFIGTANRDESTFVISDKVYDRAHTMNFTKRAPKVRNYKDPISPQYYDYKTINDLFNKAKEQGDFDAENSQLIKSVEVLLAPFNISFGNRILKQIEDFVNIYKACFIDEDVEKEAIEKILLSKVVSKLEVKTIDDKEKLEIEFEKLNLIQCLEFIKRLDNE